MNSNGQNISDNSLADGGTINGDLDIEANLNVTGDANFQDITATNAVITGTLEAGTLVADLVVEDPIIHLAKDNPADLLNTGYVEEFNDGAVKFSGILRSKDDKKHYLLENVTPQPTGGDNITALTRGDIVVRDLTTRNIDCQGLEMGLNEIRFNDVSLKSDGLGLTYMFTGQDTTNIVLFGSKLFQRQSFISSEGVKNFSEVSRGTLTTKTQSLLGDNIYNRVSSAYDGTNFKIISTVKHVCTEDTTPTAHGSKIIFSTVDNGTSNLTVKITVDDDVDLSTNIKMFLNNISDVNFLTAINATIDNLTIGLSPTDYTFPPARGTLGQVLKTDASGVVTWQPETASSETLQEAYDVSPSPQINSTTGLTVRSGTGLDPGLEVEDNLGTKTAQIFASGLGLFDALQTTNPSNLRGLSIGSIPSGFEYNFPADNQTAQEGDILTYNAGDLVFSRPLKFSQYTTTNNTSGTTNEIEMTGAGLGSLTIPANSLKVGSTFHIKIGGTLKNNNTSSDFRVRINLGGNLVADTEIVDLPFIGVLGFWEAEVDLVVRTIGVSGFMIFGSQFTYVDTGAYAGSARSGGGSFDTTIANTWGVTTQFTTASLDNQCFCQILYVNQII